MQKPQYDIIKPFLIEKKDKKILELGAGGNCYEYFKKISKDYVGIDIIKGNWEMPKKFMTQDLEKNTKLPFPDNTFDVVIAMDVLEHLTFREEILKELSRVAKDNCVFAITLPNEFSYQPVWYHIKGVNWISGNRTKWVDGKEYLTDQLSNDGHKYFYDIHQAKTYIKKELDIIKIHYAYMDGKLQFLGKLNQWLANKYPRWFARNMIFICTKKGLTSSLDGLGGEWENKL